MANSTKVVATCQSKKVTKNYNTSAGQSKFSTEIELLVPYDTTSVYYQFSGETAIKLKTTNQEAADMFEIGGEYDVFISPKSTE